MEDNVGDLHKDFWSKDRNEELRAIINEWISTHRVKQKDVVALIRQILADRTGQSATDKPSAKNFSRFLRSQSDLTNDYLVKSAAAECIAESNNRPEQADQLFVSLRKATKLRYPVYSIGEDPTIDLDRLKRSLNTINDPIRDNDPAYPEFPTLSPRYPASLTIPFKYRDFTFHVKDESSNPTGSHKDRWAREILLKYKEKIADLMEKDRIKHRSDLPVLGLISSGSAALALQAQLRLSELPNVRVIVDGQRMHSRMIERLRDYGCLVKEVDLDKRLITSEDLIKYFPGSPDIIDVSPRKLSDVRENDYYDWLSAEVLDENPDAVFVPVGSGVLFASILSFIEKIQAEKKLDARLKKIDINDTRMIKIIGATSQNSTTRMDKLFAKFRPIVDDLDGYIDELKGNGLIHPMSGIDIVDEASATHALGLIKEESIRSEVSGIAGLGLAIDYLDSGKISSQEKVVVINTGRFFYGWSV